MTAYNVYVQLDLCQALGFLKLQELWHQITERLCHSKFKVTEIQKYLKLTITC